MKKIDQTPKRLPVKRKQSKPPKVVGSKYYSNVEPHLDKVYEWLKQGYTDYSIAEQLGVHPATWIKYKEKHVNLANLYTRAKKERNVLVMNRMFGKACGEKIQIDKVKILSDGEKIPYKEELYIPSDVNAADLYLRNNDPEYKSAKAAESVGSTTINFNITELASKKSELLSEIRKLSAIDVDLIE